MKITVITVAYNSEKTIRKTIESVLGQVWSAGSLPGELADAEGLSGKLADAGCPPGEPADVEGPSGKLADAGCPPREPADVVGKRKRSADTPEVEYLIIDGASQDGTVEIAEGYRAAFEDKGIDYRIFSEPDKGIYDAMNKGVRLATGDCVGILNSDDWYESDALQTVGDTFQNTGCDLMFANIRLHRADGSTLIKKARQRKFQTSRDWNHPTTFVKRELIQEHPFRDLGIHDDYGFYLQMRKLGIQIVTVDKVLANFRMGGASNRHNLKEAVKRIRDRYLYCYRINGYSRWYLAECVAIEAAKMLL